MKPQEIYVEDLKLINRNAEDGIMVAAKQLIRD
jgi:hypothetical protein